MSHEDKLSVQPSTAKSSVPLGLVAVFITYFGAIYFFRGIGVALPKTAADLDGMPLFSWAISLPALAAAFTTLMFGKLSDVYGRRIFLLISLALYMAGAVLSAISRDFIFYIAARMILALGQGALASLCFATIGDLYDPVKRSRWSGLLQIPAGIASIIGPTMVGMITDSLSWRYFFGITVLLAAISAILVVGGVTSPVQRASHKIDFPGAFLLAAALTVMIVAFSWAGTTYSWGSYQVIGLLAISIILWIILVGVERKAKEPILDPQVMTNRTFLTAAVAGLLSYFGFLAINLYYPLFLQGVQGTTASESGQIITPFGILMAFMGVPTGFLIARTKRYKWLLIAGYTIITGATFTMVSFEVNTPVWLGVLVTTLAGFGLGAVPTINTLVSQFAVPKKLLGVAVGAIFAFVFMGGAIAPAILGSAMNQVYAKSLQNSLPIELNLIVGAEALESLADPRVLLSQDAMRSLKETCSRASDRGSAIYHETVEAIRSALETSLKMVFLISALTTFASWLLILTIPEVPIETEK